MPSTSLIWTFRGLGASAGALLLAGCIAEMAIPTVAGPGGWAPAAAGRLRLDGTCLRLDTAGGPSFLIVWPHGARIDYGSRPPLVLDGVGGRARVGETVRLGGGPVAADALAASRKTTGIIRRCGGPLFETSGFARP